MKKYFLHNGEEQQGPFNIEELKLKNITKNTSVWYEGLSEWTTADNINDLELLFVNTIPPPFFAKTINTTPLNEDNTPAYQTEKKSKINWKIYLIMGLVIIGIGFFIANNSARDRGNYGSGSTYQEKVLTVVEVERSEPATFLIADGNYNKNLWGDKLKVHGVIKNTATVASFKDAVVSITYYSKTKTELGSKDYIIYDNFPPHSEINFELNIENYKEVYSIGWTVLAATPN